VDPRDFDEIERFLTSVGKATLFEHLALAETASAEEVEAALAKRRAWAQGQQSNPKFRTEAIWTIKNMGLLKRALLQERGGYLEALLLREQGRKVLILKQYILGTLASGRLSRRDEAGVLQQARALGLPDAVAQRTLEELVAQAGAQAEREQGAEAFVDHYRALGVSPNADYNELYTAYRRRLEQLRHTLDRQLAEEQREALEESWRALSDPGAREAFDQALRARRGAQGERPPVGLPAAAGPGPIERPPSPPAPEPPPAVEPAAPPKLTLADPQKRSAAEAPKLSLAEPVAAEPEPRARPPEPPPQEPRGTPPSRLVMEPAGVLQLTVGTKPQTVEVRVRRQGEPPAPAKVWVERDWVTVEPRQLSPTLDEQVLRLTVHPDKMDRAHAVALITVLAELTGQRTTLTLEVTRATRWWPRALAAAVLLVGLVGGGLALWPLLAPDPAPAGPSSGTLVVQVDPPAGEIIVNGEILSTNGRLVLSEGLTGPPVTVAVQLDGFEGHREVVQVPRGERVELRPSLKLIDRMDLVVPIDEPPGPIDEAKARAALDATAPAAAACLARFGPGSPGDDIELTATLISTHDGWIRRVQFQQPKLDRDPLRGCLRRVVRATRLPFVTGYGSTTYTWRAKKDAKP
jgi:hypothetical protein